MALTNAQRQARWRERRETELQRLRKLEAELHAAKAPAAKRARRRKGGPKDIPTSVGLKR